MKKKIRVKTHHNASLDLGDDTVIAGAQVDGAHESDTESNSLSLSRHDDDLLVDLNVGLVSKETRDHELCAVADGVDGRVLDDEPLVTSEERLERSDDASEVGLCDGTTRERTISATVPRREEEKNG